jgi:hypothetical protein
MERSREHGKEILARPSPRITSYGCMVSLWDEETMEKLQKGEIGT